MNLYDFDETIYDGDSTQRFCALLLQKISHAPSLICRASSQQ